MVHVRLDTRWCEFQQHWWCGEAAVQGKRGMNEDETDLWIRAEDDRQKEHPTWEGDTDRIGWEHAP